MVNIARPLIRALAAGSALQATATPTPARNGEASLEPAAHPLSSSPLPKGQSLGPRGDGLERRKGGSHSSSGGNHVSGAKIGGCVVGGLAATGAGAALGGKIAGPAGAVGGGFLAAAAVGVGCAFPEIKEAVQEHGRHAAPSQSSPSPLGDVPSGGV